MPSRRSFHNKTPYRFLLFLLLVLTIVSCAPETTFPSNVVLPTVCPGETITVPHPLNHNVSNKYIVVLIDKSGSYRRYDPVHDYAAESLLLINDVLAQTLSPGDRVFIDWIANDKDHDREKVIFEGEVERVIEEMPNYEPTPQVPDLIPTLPVSGTDIQKDKIKKQNLEIEEQNQLKLAEHDCKVHKWNEDARLENERIDAEWKKKHDNAIDKFMIPLNNSISGAVAETHSQETHLYEGLSMASRKFHEPLIQKHYDEYILIIFSDMIDSHRGKDEYKYYDINLSNVDVLVGNYLCLKDYKICLGQTASIQDHFREIYKTKSALVKFPVETNQEILINFIVKGQ